MAGLWELGFSLYFPSCLQTNAQFPFISAVESQAVDWPSHTRENTWMWSHYGWNFPALCGEEHNLALVGAVGLLSFCRVACGSSSLQGYQCSCWGRCGNKRCRLPLSPYGAMLQGVCPAISPTINRATLLSPPSCYNLLKRWCLDLYADILDSPASSLP